MARAGDDGLAGKIAFLEQLKTEVQRGSDFFAGLAAATASLTDQPTRKAVKDLLSRYASRQSLPQCLEPLEKAGGLLARLAADVQRAGWENSAALRLSVLHISDRAAALWRRRSRFRVLIGLVERRRSFWRHLVFGAAVGHLAFASEAGLPLQYWLNAAAVSAGFRLMLLIRSRLTFALAAAAASLLLPVILTQWYLPESPFERGIPTPHTVFTDRNLRDEIEALVSATPSRLQECRVSTGFTPGWARLREHPATSAWTIGYVLEETRLIVLTEHDGGFQDGEWLLVQAPSGLEGWVYGALCTEAGGAQD